MHIRAYRKIYDEDKLMTMIENEEGWTYADDSMSEKYKIALDNSITYVAYEEGDILCGYSRSIDDCGLYIYVCDLLVMPSYRGRNIGRKLMECIYNDYPSNIVYVMSDVDEYYKKQGYKCEGSIFEVPNNNE